ncbi:ABC transporter permease [Hespellia stercorisuis]|uniref:Simple sugar transport system permease protein n=1 Tax=Hespellia stercorisuis DSM 15480 TaxID=1121950 RepID=A0A1M6VDS3_9FIRM|nr:ABC transporter permease [Hespellia stercorisuis]SHK79495.1 simple sugar transport system permease protein [Hespellia stercorisuis DSM 15480]
MDTIVSLFSSVVRMSTPILICALGAVFSERAGVINVGLEGLMLIGALFGVLGSFCTGSAFLGAVTAMAAGLLFALIYAFFTITVKADQTVVGIAFNTIAGGLTVVLYRVLLANSGVSQVKGFNTVAIPGLSQIPVIGPIFFEQSVPIYILYFLIPVLAIVFSKMNIGLKVRAVGDNPVACDTVGISVVKVRYMTVLFSGVMAGMAGAFVSMGQLRFFTEGMISGTGFIAFATVIFGNYTPLGVLRAGLIFGCASALQYKFQTSGSAVPYQVWIMLPYLITILALCLYHKKSNAPKYSGVSFSKD